MRNDDKVKEIHIDILQGRGCTLLLKMLQSIVTYSSTRLESGTKYDATEGERGYKRYNPCKLFTCKNNTYAAVLGSLKDEFS